MIKDNLYLKVLSKPSYRAFWLGATLSSTGDILTRVALTWYVLEQTNSPVAVGLLTAVYSAPVIIGGLVAGWLLDRFDRKLVLTIDSVARGVVIGLIPVLHLLGALSLWYVYFAAGVYGLLMMVSLAGTPAMIPDLVDEDELATANSLETLSFTLAWVIGPPVAGLLIARIGAPEVAALDALSYFAFALALMQVHVKAKAKVSESPGQSQNGIKDAVALLLRNPVLLSTTLMFLTANIGLGLVNVWLPVYADNQPGGGSELFGLLLGIMAVGEVISAVLVGNFKLPIAAGALIALAQILAGAALVLPLLTLNVWMMGIGLFLLGFFSSPLTILAQTLRMQVIPDQLRGRAFALLRTIMQGSTPLGGVIAGTALPLIGMLPMIGLSALLIGGPGMAGLAVPELRAAGQPAASSPEPSETPA